MSNYLESDKEEIQAVIDALRELNSNIGPVNAGLTTTADAIAKIAHSSMALEQARKNTADADKAEAQAQSARAKAFRDTANAVLAEEDSLNKSIAAESRARQAAHQEQLKQLQIEEKQLLIAEKKQRLAEKAAQAEKAAREAEAKEKAAKEEKIRAGLSREDPEFEAARQELKRRMQQFDTTPGHTAEERKKFREQQKAELGLQASHTYAEGSFAERKAARIAATEADYRRRTKDERRKAYQEKVKQAAAEQAAEQKARKERQARLNQAMTEIADEFGDYVKEKEKEEAKADKERASKRKKLLAIGIAAITGTIKKLISAGERIAKEFNNMQQTANKMGMGSNLSSFYAGTAADMSRAESGKKGFETAVSYMWGKMKLGFDILVSKLPLVASTVQDIAQLSRQNAIAAAAKNLVGAGVKYGQAAALGTNIEIMAAEYIRKYTDRDKDGNLISLDEARADERYSEVAAAFTSLVASGGKYDMFNADLATAWGFEQGKWNPNVQYTDAFMADLRSQYLTEAMTKYMSGGSDALADMQNRLAKTQKIIGTMAGQLFSFDEVETQQAISTADTAEAINYFGEEATDALRNEEEWLEEITKKYGLSAEQVANIRRILSDTDMTMDDINDMLAAGIRFDDASTSAIMALSTEFGLGSAGIISAFELYAGNLEAALAKIETLGKTGEELEDWLKDPVLTLEELLQIGPTKPAETYEDYVEPLTLAELLAMNGIGTPDPPSTTGSSYTRANMLSTYAPYQQTNTYFQALQKAANQRTTPSWYTPSHATGGIGTVRETNATLFENGPEAVIPLNTDLGKTFMADAISAAIGNTNIGGDTVNVTIAGPVFTESERQLNKWATELGDRYNQIKARRGGK